MLKNWWKAVIDLVFPLNCLVCKKPINKNQPCPVCATCLGKVEKNLPPFCAKCGSNLKESELEKGICSSCRARDYYFKRAWSATVYGGITEQLIHMFKYRNRPQLARPLSAIMIDFMNTYNLALKGFDCLLAVPLHSSKLREREYNQSRLLAENISAAFKIPFSEGNLLRRRATKPQSNLKPQERWSNVSGAFALRKPEEFRGKRVLLVDDLLTTGATCSEISRILNESGANNVHVLTLAIAQ